MTKYKQNLSFRADGVAVESGSASQMQSQQMQVRAATLGGGASGGSAGGASGGSSSGGATGGSTMGGSVHMGGASAPSGAMSGSQQMGAAKMAAVSSGFVEEERRKSFGDTDYNTPTRTTTPVEKNGGTGGGTGGGNHGHGNPGSDIAPCREGTEQPQDTEEDSWTLLGVTWKKLYWVLSASTAALMLVVVFTLLIHHLKTN